MAKEGLSDRTQQFLGRTIYSIGQLEILLLLFRNPDRSWTYQEVAREVRGNPDSALNHLRVLASHSLLAESQERSYKYQPQSQELAQDVQDLAAAYASHRTRVIELIYSDRNQKLIDLANAFRLRKGD